MFWIKKNSMLQLFNKNSIHFDENLVIDKSIIKNRYLLDTMTTLRKTGDVHICKVATRKNEDVCLKFLTDREINNGSTDINFINKINKQSNCIKTKSIAKLSDDYRPYRHLIEVEYANQGSLYTFLETQPKKRIVWALLFKLMKGIGSLHSQGILHNDIKPSNILVTRKNYYSILFYSMISILSEIKKCVLQNTLLLRLLKTIFIQHNRISGHSGSCSMSCL